MPLDNKQAAPTAPSAPATSDSVVHIVVHKLLKDEDGSFAAECRPTSNEVSSTASKVVALLLQEYAKRSGKSHGRFETDTNNYPVQGYLRQYHVEKSINFLELSTLMMSTLCTKAKGTAATSGSVIFSHIQNGQIHSILVAILTAEWGASLDKKMDFAGGEYLDLKGFRFAGRINITDWLSEEDKYLNFLKGKGNKVSEYFKSFLGCNSSVTDVIETKILREALEEFAENKKMDEATKSAFFESAFEICNDLAKSHTPIDLRAFANKLFSENPEELEEVFSNPERKLSDGFIPDRRALKSFTSFSAKTRSWKVEFSRDAIISRDVQFNDDESLTLFNLPPELKQKLRRELKEEDE